MIVDNNSTLNVTGTIWVQGTLRFDNGCYIQLDPGYGSNSGVIVADDMATVNPGCEFSGSGDPESFPMLLSGKDSPSSTVIQIDNTSTGMIYYAAHGRITFKQGATAKEATAYGLTLENNAVITYDTGLSNVNFSSGPAGGLVITVWREIAL